MTNATSSNFCIANSQLIHAIHAFNRCIKRNQPWHKYPVYLHSLQEQVIITCHLKPAVSDPRNWKKIGIYAMFIFMLGLYLHIHSCMLIFFFQLLVEFTDCVSNFQGDIKYLSPLIEKKQRQIFFSIYLWMSKKLRRPPKLMILAHQCLFQQRNEERKGNGNTK